MSTSVPESLKPSTMSSISTMDIETNVLDPIVINQNFCRFVLDRKGILDMGSVITLAVTCSPTASKKAYLPIKTGIHGLIKRAVLRIGSKIVAITDEYGTYMTIRRQFKTPEEKSQKDMVKVGTVDVVCPDNEQDGLLQLRDCQYDGNTTAQPLPQFVIQDTDQTTPLFSVKISELFPAMREIQLPLYLINEPCSIELTFNTQGASDAEEGKICCFDSSITAVDKAVSVSTTNVKFLADYLTYSDDQMEQTAKMVMSESGMIIPYEDVVMTSTNFPALGAQPPAGNTQVSKVVRDLGLSGMNVRAVMAHMKKVGVNKLLGQYSSDAYDVPDQYNIRINDKQFYPREVVSESYKSYQLGQVFGTDISVHSAEYSKDIATNKDASDNLVNNQPFTAATYAGNNMVELLGSQHYLGVDLTTSPLNAPGVGQVIGQKPVQMMHTLTNTNTDYGGRDVRYFSTVERLMTLKGGQVMVTA